MSRHQKIDPTDRAIINRIQSEFPMTSRPFSTIAEELSLTEKEVIQRVRHLKQIGLIRRIGGNFVPGKLDHVSTLCAARVDENRVAEFAETVNRYPGVTHNYQRDGEYNIWFTFIAPSREEIEANLEAISKDTGITDILNLPATHVFKIKAEFKV